MPIGFENSFGKPPSAIITSGITNDKHYIHYMNKTRGLGIPVINMDSTYETFDTPDDELLYNTVIEQRIDVLMHVAACAGLSTFNTQVHGSKKRGCPDNDQNQNMYNLTKLGMRMNSKVVVFENAPGAYTKLGEKVLQKLIGIASDNNYSTHLFRTDTILHGIPQKRKRTFIMFYRDSNPGLFNFEHIKYVPLPEYLKLVDESSPHWDLLVTPEIKDPYSEFIIDYSGERTFKKAIEKIAKETQSYSAFSAISLIRIIGFDVAIEWFKTKEKEAKTEQDKNKYTKGLASLQRYKEKVQRSLEFWDNSTMLPYNGLYVNGIISRNIYRLMHAEEERSYNVRELLHLMGHPSDFEMLNPDKNVPHITQNVPVKTATFIGSQIRKYLDGDIEISTSSFVKQDNIKQRTDVPAKPRIGEW
jgi:site-specific DNA-cytosine methylase